MIRARAIVLCLATLAALPAMAEDDPEDYDPSVLQGCLDATWFREGGPSECIGVGAAHCLQSEAGQSTLGIGVCFSLEWSQWDALLNEAYQEVRANQQAVDAETRDVRASMPSSEAALREMQRAWITFRDAACDFEYTRWAGGSGAGPASAQCMLELTARQTIFLLETMQ